MGNSNKKDIIYKIEKVENSCEKVEKPCEIKENPLEKVENEFHYLDFEPFNLYKDECSRNICMKCNKNLQNVFYFLLPKCGHIFCSICLCNHVHEFLDPKVKCPLPQCEKMIADSIIRQCLTNYEIELYENKCKNKVAVKCLVAECSYFVVPEKKEGHFICPECAQPNCLTCSMLHSIDEPCGSSPNLEQFRTDGAENVKMRYANNLRRITKEMDLYVNPETSVCTICLDFLIPRQGILIMGCTHKICRECLKKHLEAVNNIFQFKCPVCNAKLQDRECTAIVGEKLMDSLRLKAIGSRFFNCQTPNCENIWDKDEFNGFHKCGLCQKNNCMACGAIHENVNCNTYRKSDEYKKRQKEKEYLDSFASIKCYYCANAIFIKEGGCGSMNCENCKCDVCKYTGLAVGPKGCKCTPSKPCHENCKGGCFPDIK